MGYSPSSRLAIRPFAQKQHPSEFAGRLSSQLNERSTEFDPNQNYYLHCKAGVHSLKALNFLRQQGFKYLKSVKGGIMAWSDEIHRNVSRY